MTEDLRLTDLLRNAQDGDQAALSQVFEATYQDLRRMARHRLTHGARNAPLDTSAVVHESFLKFTAAGQLRIEDRRHFFRYAGQVMRSVIVDLVRAELADRRGAGAVHISLDTDICDAASDRTAEGEILRIHEALEELALLDERMVEVVEMRYFAGMTAAEVAAALEVNERTVRRDWEKARLLLARALAED